MNKEKAPKEGSLRQEWQVWRMGEPCTLFCILPSLHDALYKGENKQTTITTKLTDKISDSFVPKELDSRQAEKWGWSLLISDCISALTFILQTNCSSKSVKLEERERGGQ